MVPNTQSVAEKLPETNRKAPARKPFQKESSNHPFSDANCWFLGGYLLVGKTWFYDSGKKCTLDASDLFSLGHPLENQDTCWAIWYCGWSCHNLWAGRCWCRNTTATTTRRPSARTELTWRFWDTKTCATIHLCKKGRTNGRKSGGVIHSSSENLGLVFDMFVNWGGWDRPCVGFRAWIFGVEMFWWFCWLREKSGLSNTRLANVS